MSVSGSHVDMCQKSFPNLFNAFLFIDPCEFLNNFYNKSITWTLFKI